MFIGRTHAAVAAFAIALPIWATAQPATDEPGIVEYSDLPPSPAAAAAQDIQGDQGLSLIIHDSFQGRLCVFQNRAYSSGARVRMDDGIYVCQQDDESGVFVEPQTGGATAPTAALTWRKVQ